MKSLPPEVLDGWSTAHIEWLTIDSALEVAIRAILIGGLLQPHGSSWIGAVSVISWGGARRWTAGVVFCEGGGGVVRNVRGKGVLTLTAVSYSAVSTCAVLAWIEAYVSCT